MRKWIFLLLAIFVAAECRAQSVLSSGRWIKVAVEQEGVYRIPYSKLRSLGFANPQNVRIFGNHDGMLPFMNAEERTHDLAENKIIHSGDAVLFYATGADIWKYDDEIGMIMPRRHLYSRKAYYFITDNPASADNTMPLSSSQSTDAQTVDEGTFWYGHEEDYVNLNMSGRKWYGENFFYKNEYKIDFQCNDAPKTGVLHSEMICRSSVKNGFSVSWGDGASSVTFDPVTSSELYADTKAVTFQCHPQNSASQTVELIFDKKASSAECYLDFVVINTTEPLKYNGKQLIFSHAGQNSAVKFAVSNPPRGGLMALDVSDSYNPQRMDVETTDGVGYFASTPSLQSRYVIFEPVTAPEPEYLADSEANVANQNLHGIKTPDFLIIAPPVLMKYAERIKSIHSGLVTATASTTQIYNEFSSGMRDVPAIRDFIKFLYDKRDDGRTLKYVLLLGDGSVDNLTESSSNPNLIPTYQSPGSLNENGRYSIVSDDFYGLLGDDEGETDGRLDVAVGRLPVKNEAEAEVVVRKIENYIKGDFSNAWRKSVTFIADDENNNVHNTQADFIASQVESRHPEYDVKKIYIDSYKQNATATGNTYPGARTEINRMLNQGTLIINYVGHGGMKYFADERILTLSDINEAKNGSRLPIFITASCDIGHFDYYERATDKTIDSPAERLILNENGGAIALFTTTREVLSSPNFTLNKNISKYIFEPTADHDGPTRLGDIIRRAKLDTDDYNMLSFTLLGDPALKMPFPSSEIVVESIDGVPAADFNDTLKAMSTYTITCRIKDSDRFDGTAFVSFFDKPSTVSTLNNDGHGVFDYEDYKTKIFSGSATVASGRFKVKFTVPKDIDYNVGNGKLSLYAASKSGDEAVGVMKSIKVGSSSLNAPDDHTGPEIKMTIGDGNAVDGASVKSKRPVLTIELADSSGINTACNGHDIILVVDDSDAPTNLTEYYTAHKDRSTGGTISYQLPELSDGRHTVRLKAWDNLNNSNEELATFEVIGTSRLTISHLLNYPNPFTDHTSFYFEHNNPQSMIQYELTVFTMSGKIVRTMTGTFANGKTTSEPIEWDGRDNHGNQIARGVYFYRLRIMDDDGRKANAREKLLYLK